METLQEIHIKPQTSFEKNKEYIQVYREKHREKYLEMQAKYMKKRMDDPVLRAENRRKVNERYWRMKAEKIKEAEANGTILGEKRGRTRKYPHLYE